MPRPIKQIAIFLMMIGILGVALNQIFGYSMITNIEKIKDPITNMYYYKYDFAKYFKNIALNINKITEMQLNPPTRAWNNEIINNLAVILDYLILIVNVILYPVRLGAYVISNLFAILGIEYNQQNMSNWLVIFIQALTQAQIPYV